MKRPKAANLVVRIAIRAKPRAKISRILRAEGLSADVAIAAPPADGAANDELRSILSSALGAPKRDLRLVSGPSSKSKIVEVSGITPGDVEARLGASARR